MKNAWIRRLIQVTCPYNSNIQHILNGADYDSDTMLLTDNEILIQGGKISKMRFPTPINKLSYDKATKSLTKIDIEIGKNKIGEIVNLSQKFNSVLWAMMFQSESLPSEFSSRKAQNEVYSYCAILEVLSNTEIDKAKRIYNIDAEKELHRLNSIYKKEYQPYFAVPNFFTFITTGKSAREKSGHKVNACPMQYIYNRAFDDNVKRGKNGRPLSDIITDNSAGADIKTVNSIIKKAESVHAKRTALCARLHSNMYKIHNASVQNAISRETLSFFRSLRQEKLSPADILALIKHIDEKGKDITEADWLLLAALCNSGHDDELGFSNTENTVIYSMLKKNPPGAEYDPDGIRKELFRVLGVN